MKTFLNEEKKAFKDLSDDEMIAVIRAKLSGNCEVLHHIEEWEHSGIGAINFANIYRSTPPKQLVIPWVVIRKDIKVVVLDQHMRPFGFLHDIALRGDRWDGACGISLKCLNIDTEGIDWRSSKVKRPEGV